ncbi:uncharacterized protein I303_101785 [Kwoniella dejecticola CBS 10117]|uniref:Uncharacterized protein n=1 Tax=Kwoniella dejecticola CBS 10117 TaxID=1296121 RepID=A0A1A6ACT3_9TREE|nr:uncharacterized protein I303_02079 [Kwoniella dejecticola CBS 10117]OBR87865.1 hypothetical protein I303_02079 [Kwoniella dejecticola CBS 10117]
MTFILHGNIDDAYERRLFDAEGKTFYPYLQSESVIPQPSDAQNYATSMPSTSSLQIPCNISPDSPAEFSGHVTPDPPPPYSELVRHMSQVQLSGRASDDASSGIPASTSSSNEAFDGQRPTGLLETSLQMPQATATVVTSAVPLQSSSPEPSIDFSSPDPNTQTSMAEPGSQLPFPGVASHTHHSVTITKYLAAGSMWDFWLAEHPVYGKIVVKLVHEIDNRCKDPRYDPYIRREEIFPGITQRRFVLSWSVEGTSRRPSPEILCLIRVRIGLEQFEDFTSDSIPKSYFAQLSDPERFIQEMRDAEEEGDISETESLKEENRIMSELRSELYWGIGQAI